MKKDLKDGRFQTEDDGNKQDKAPSRRQFIKGLAGVSAGVASAAMLGGCANSTKDTGSAQGETSGGTGSGERPYSMYTCDTLIVGGGIAGFSAALRLMSEGVSDIIIVDKSRIGHSGNSGMSWGHEYFTNEFYEGDPTDLAGAFGLMSQGIADQDNVAAFAKECHDHGPIAMHEAMGNVVMRYEAGEILVDPKAPMSTHRGFRVRQYAQYLSKLGVRIFDYTMINDILTDDSGHISGAVGIDLLYGDACVFRCKTAVLAAGGYVWHTGGTIGSPECTGEGHIICLKHGCKMKDAEFYSVDLDVAAPWSTNGPEGNRVDIASFIFINGLTGARIYNKDLYPFAEKYFASPKATEFFGAAFQDTNIRSVQEMYAGRALDGAGIGCYTALPDRGNGIWLDCKGYYTDRTYPAAMYREECIDVREVGYDYTDQSGLGGDHNLQMCVPDFYCSQGSIEYDSNTNEIKGVPGLYYAMWIMNEIQSITSWSMGQLSGVNAATATKAMTALPGFKEEDIQAILNKCYGYLESEPANPVRVTDIFQKIQSTFYHNLSQFRNDESMTQAFTELDRIWKEDLPNMYCADRSRRFNRDWRNAMEAESMLLASMATAKAGLYRTESRPYHYRTDYPLMDMENWMVNVWVEWKEEGNTWTVTKSDPIDTYVSREEMKSMIPPFDMANPNEPY
ncbi:MAG: FAD-binding protein [Actinobacteria bacterium]|nr:FAD-binding protein [Actinomycetota bacterium]